MSNVLPLESGVSVIASSYSETEYREKNFVVLRNLDDFKMFIRMIRNTNDIQTPEVQDVLSNVLGLSMQNLLHFTDEPNGLASAVNNEYRDKRQIMFEDILLKILSNNKAWNENMVLKIRMKVSTFQDALTNKKNGYSITNYNMDFVPVVVESGRTRSNDADKIKAGLELLQHQKYYTIDGTPEVYICLASDETVPILNVSASSGRYVTYQKAGKKSGYKPSFEVHSIEDDYYRARTDSTVLKTVFNTITTCLKQSDVKSWSDGKPQVDYGILNRVFGTLLKVYRHQISEGKKKFTVDGISREELQNMVEQDFTPVTKKIQTALENYKQDSAYQKDLEVYAPTLSHVLKSNGKYIVYTMGRVRFTDCSFPNNIPAVQAVNIHNSYDMLPDDIKGKMSVLDTMTNPTATQFGMTRQYTYGSDFSGTNWETHYSTNFLKDTGFKVTENRWWVFFD